MGQGIPDFQDRHGIDEASKAVELASKDPGRATGQAGEGSEHFDRVQRGQAPDREL